MHRSMLLRLVRYTAGWPLLAMALGLGGCASTESEATSTKVTMATPSRSLEDQWGIQLVSLRLTAAGQMIDFRYRVIDPAKAAPLVDRKLKPYLIDRASRQRLGVPMAPKVGSLRQTSLKAQAGRVYFVLFSNAAGIIKPGSKVAVVIGDFRADDLTVE